jgi:hypothetical protein
MFPTMYGHHQAYLKITVKKVIAVVDVGLLVCNAS